MRIFTVLPLLLLSGCVIAALGVGAAAGILVHEAYIAEDSFEAIYRAKADATFEAAISVMDELAAETTHSRRERTVRGEVRGAEVKIQVKEKESSSNEVVVTITARKNYLADRETAQFVFGQLNRKITKS